MHRSIPKWFENELGHITKTDHGYYIELVAPKWSGRFQSIEEAHKAAIVATRTFVSNAGDRDERLAECKMRASELRAALAIADSEIALLEQPQPDLGTLDKYKELLDDADILLRDFNYLNDQRIQSVAFRFTTASKDRDGDGDVDPDFVASGYRHPEFVKD